ncbi:glycosyltransferase family 8 protein [Brevibacillus sp. H7]|uniref:glycosyltransferase family 8 protein n=1 Tax=Brevibacillus sp. H7 TaxID=3349138 RepID=UPI003811A27D
MEHIHIVTTTNDNYAKHLAVMLNSLLVNKVSGNPVKIYVLYGNLFQQNKHKLNRAIKKFNVTIKFLKVNKSLFNNIKVRGFSRYLSKETYYRISLPDLLNKDVQKALYLDTDVIVTDDITKLWNTNIDDYTIAAVKKPNFDRYKDLSIPKKANYFNAGVMLINVQRWREEDISKKVLEFIHNNPSKIQFYSQDPLNAILHGKWLKLGPEWNYTTAHLKLLKRPIHPSIIHYTGPKKPWNHGHPLQKDYFKYSYATLWEQDDD